MGNWGSGVEGRKFKDNLLFVYTKKAESFMINNPRRGFRSVWNTGSLCILSQNKRENERQSKQNNQ